MNEPPTSPALDVTEPAPPLITLASESPADAAAQAAAAQSRAAAAQSVPFLWQGRELAPFTPSREAAFHAHRAALNAPELRDALNDARSFAADAARMLWFLSHQPREWLGFLAAQPRGEMTATGWEPVNAHAALEEKIQRWMDDTFSGGDAERVEAYVLCVEILTRSTMLRAKHADPADPDDPGNAHGRRTM